MMAQRGNILFLILLAVVLFAALSYAVTGALRGGGRDSGAEFARTGAATILQWFGTVDAAVMRMNLVKGIKYEDISFRYDALYNGGAPLTGYEYNPRCTTNECLVFHPDGGGVAPPDFTKFAIPNPVDGISSSTLGPGYVVHDMVKWPGAGTDLSDVVVSIYFVQGRVCDAINDAMGITAIPGTTGSPTVYARHVAQWDTSTMAVTVNADQLYGKDTFAHVYAGAGDKRRCHVRHLVIAR